MICSPPSWLSAVCSTPRIVTAHGTSTRRFASNRPRRTSISPSARGGMADGNVPTSKVLEICISAAVRRTFTSGKSNIPSSVAISRRKARVRRIASAFSIPAKTNGSLAMPGPSVLSAKCLSICTKAAEFPAKSLRKRLRSRNTSRICPAPCLIRLILRAIGPKNT